MTEPVTLYCRADVIQRECRGCPVCMPHFEATATIEPAPWNTPFPTQRKPEDA